MELSLNEIAISPPENDEIVIEMHAAPFHPVDMAMLFARSDPATGRRSLREGRDVTTLRATAHALQMQNARWNVSMLVGTEGAGQVVAAGQAPEAQALMGRKVAIWGGGTYARYRKVHFAEAMTLPDAVSTDEGAFAHLNPLTALGMIETMRDEGHRALVHTAAASTVGQILCRLCREEQIPLVNIVRRPEQVDLLRSIGAEFVCDLADPDFEQKLAEALRQTGATIAFDATGGGDLANKILRQMEVSVTSGQPFDHSGSMVRKRVLIYGSLDPSPLVLHKNYGWSWDVGGYTVYEMLHRIGPDRSSKLKQKIARDLKTSFAVSVGRRIKLEQLTDPDVLCEANQRATGGKFLVYLMG